MDRGMRLGVCYYPEHWPEDWWAEDAERMRDLGINLVRIGEFAWSRIEPEPGRFDWGWLDRAIETLAARGLRIVLGTPTATPPKWLVDRHPDMLAVDEQGRPRRFGSRRHYCFSHEPYRAECARIVTAVAERYGNHPAIVAWQTDNEYGCHDTTISYSAAALARFRRWLAARYGTVQALNRAWGAVFWSQEYRGFEEVDAPILTVTEANPSHRMDWWRFASDEVVSFNRLQVDILRRLSPGRDVVHNFMGFYTEFDHFAVSRDLDVATWDSYPLGFTEQFWFTPADKERYRRQGHPDIAAFHHDLYRGCGQGRMWVMEQQPGPVNWAAYNPAPLPGMVRAWTWEAFAHGAEVVSYFRWRQCPFAQEQNHAGLHLPDRSEDAGAGEARQVAEEIAGLPDAGPSGKAPVALVFDYEADWLSRIQPQGRSYRWLELAFAVYSGLRRLGLDVDMVPPGADLTGYRLVVAPSLPIASEAFVAAAERSGAHLLIGPRSGSRTPELHIPAGLAPGPLSRLIPLAVTRVESLRPDSDDAVLLNGERLGVERWREHVRTNLAPLAVHADGGGAWFRHGRVDYLACWPGSDLLDRVLRDKAAAAGLAVTEMPEGVRTRARGGLRFAVNYAPEPRPVPAPPGTRFLIGGPELPPAGVAAWRE
ncbi:MAG TPA: beta-galactosidase [Azospirillaceae bacterium]|nr:beta-galactosidase [Azospirillaceae bacterium]